MIIFKQTSHLMNQQLPCVLRRYFYFTMEILWNKGCATITQSLLEAFKFFKTRSIFWEEDPGSQIKCRDDIKRIEKKIYKNTYRSE